MKKLFRYIGSWAHWLAAKIADGLIRIATFAVLAAIMVVACTYVIDYAYEKGRQPCVSNDYHYKTVVERKLWKSGEQEDRLYLVKFELTQQIEVDGLPGEKVKWFRAWLTPEQYAEIKEGHTINLQETKGGGYIINDWLVTIEDF